MVSLDASHREVRVWSGFVYVEVGWMEERRGRVGVVVWSMLMFMSTSAGDGSE